MRRYVVPTTIGMLCVALQLFWLNRWFIGPYMLNAAVAFVIVATLQWGWRYGLTMATIIGLALTSWTALSGWSYPVALMVTVGITWLSSTRIFTTRSAASFVATIAIASVGYGLVFMGVEVVQGVFVHDRIHIQYVAMVIAALVSAIVHPIGISIIWRWMRWDRYEHVSTRQTYG